MIDAVNAFVLHLEEDGILHLEGLIASGELKKITSY